jgi:hypothetical protein
MGSPLARADQALQSVMEDLAAIEHQRWATWQRYVHEHGVRQVDGSLVLSVDLVARWERQIATPYQSLTEEEKESDRDQVRKYFPIVRKLMELQG